MYDDKEKTIELERKISENKILEKRIKEIEYDNNEKTKELEKLISSELNNLNTISNFEKQFENKVGELNKSLNDCAKYEKEINEEKEKTKELEKIV